MALETSENTVSDNEINSKGEVGVGKLHIGKYRTLEIIRFTVVSRNLDDVTPVRL